MQDTLKLMVVAPGSIYSTFDTYNYYLDGLGQQDDISDLWGFAFHNVIEYHKLGREGMYNTYGIMYGDETHDIVRAARELIVEIVLRKPDALLFIDGSKFPPVLLEEIHKLRREIIRNFVVACYATEAPYINDIIDKYAVFYDVLFVNDKKDAERRNPNNDRFIFYLPHSYSETVHYAGDVDDKYNKDVFFCGTVFPERAKILSDVDWTDIDALLCGTWALTDDSEYNKIKEFGVVSDSGLPNYEVAQYYRGSKIAINMNRTFGWTPKLDLQHIEADLAYSVGPRVIEAVACGAFVLSEPRPEITDIFGESIPTFTTGKELENLIRYYLTHEDERIAKAKQAYDIVQGMTYNNRSKFVADMLLEAIKTRRLTEVTNG